MSGYTSVVTTPSKTLTTSYEYTYSSENISEIVDSNGNTTRYVYDDLDQLIREDNEAQGKTYVYTYDNAGNRTSKTTYAYTTDSVNDLTPTETQTYTYDSTGAWGDQLTLVQTAGGAWALFSYDAIGNPVVYNGYLMTWDGRRLMTANGSGNEITYAYNSDGLRTRKTVNGVDHIYTLEGSRIVTESWGDNLLIFLYDESGAPIGMQYRTDSYAANRFDTFYFEKNLFGDIVAVYNSSGVKVISYTYDAWGNQTVQWHDSYSTNFNAYYNPFRYRGYYYDTDTGFYYLQSRYYNPQWGRFLNADGYVNANGDMIGFNMYAYCSNNPVMGYDSTGEMCVSRLTTKSGLDHKLFLDLPAILYDVPLYKQKWTNLCWAFDQLMVESWRLNVVYSDKEAEEKARQMAIRTYKPTQHKNPENHFGSPEHSSTVNFLVNIYMLYYLLDQYGPIYARYENQFGYGHSIVITGVDVSNNIVYTNNSHGVRGQQSYEEFLNGVCRPWYMPRVNKYKFDFVYIP